MTILSITKKTDHMMNLNVYPGVIRVGDFSPGAWFALNKDGTTSAGVTVGWSPVGLAYSTR